ncbi:hypothetical protein MKX01_011774 [Papaver californicum]|nr:hypothetical protein MKX01_011774 [Papaver californicum]
MAVLGKRSRDTTAGSSSSTNGDGAGVDYDVIDDFNLALLSEDGDNEVNNPISDSIYAENIGIQEALMASFQKLKQTQIIRSEVKIEPNLDTTTTTTTATTTTTNKRIKKEVIVKIESAETICGVCKEMKTMGEIFIRRDTATTASTSTRKCTHTFCFECLRKHIVAKIQENEVVIKCPELECQEILEPLSCQGLIPKEVFDRWGEAISGSLFIGSVVIYCPFDDCNGMLVNDGGGDAIREAECMHCRRLFCAQCKVPWHSDTNCGDFQKLVGERGIQDI